MPIKSLKDEITLFSKLFSPKMIGLHLRRTDGTFSERDWTATDKMLKRRMSEWSQQGYQFFLATDDEEVSYDFPVLKYTPSVSKYNNDKHNAQSAVVDMFLLSKCDVIIGTVHSSFSFTALLLNKPTTDLWYISEDPKTVEQIKIET